MKLDFGKYSGSDIRDVPRGYLEWLLNKNLTVNAALTVELRRRDELDGQEEAEAEGAAIVPQTQAIQAARELTVICDGACSPVNPGGYGLWALVVYEGDVSGARGQRRPAPLDSRRGCLGKGEGMTNNVSEYHAIIESLRWVQRHARAVAVEVRSDSQLVVRQANREYGCNADHLRSLYDTCLGLLSGLPGVRVVWVPREETYVADVLTRVAYQEALRAEAA